MKVRLVKGPFGGKVMDVSEQETITITGPKRETREQKYNRMAENFSSGQFRTYWGHEATPMVRATYRRAVRPHYSLDGSRTFLLACVHPDGSVFYEWTGDKREFNPSF